MSWLVRTPCTCAMSLMRSARANEPPRSTSIDRPRTLRNMLQALRSKRCERGVEEARQPAHGIRAVHHALTGVTDVSIREPVRRHGVVRGDVRRPDDSGNVHEFVALIELQ